MDLKTSLEYVEGQFEEVKEISQEIFELAHSYNSELKEWTIEELRTALKSIQESSTDLQKEMGNSTTISYIGHKKPATSVAAPTFKTAQQIEEENKK